MFNDEVFIPQITEEKPKYAAYIEHTQYGFRIVADCLPE
jgi:hypothetical protein